MLNNDWIADKLHELLKHAESEGEILLSCPFHLVGIGNGACIAAGVHLSPYISFSSSPQLCNYCSLCATLRKQQALREQLEVFGLDKRIPVPRSTALRHIALGLPGVRVRSTLEVTSATPLS